MTEPIVEVETTDADTDGGDNTYVHASIIGTDGRNHTASAFMDGEASDEDVARALIGVALAVANMHSSGAWIALQRMISADVQP